MHRHASHSLLGVLLALLLAGRTLTAAEGPEPAVSAVGHQSEGRPAQDLDKNREGFAGTVKKVAPAVVRIITAISYTNSTALTSGRQYSLRSYVAGPVPQLRSGPVEGGLGSGVIITESGYILTTSHLVAGAIEVEVTLQDGRDFAAIVIGADAKSDIAVVKIQADHLPTIPMGESREVQVGDMVLAIGHPFGVGQTVTHGIVSATDRGGIGIEDYESFIQTDAPINPGNSGGALVDISGHLIGINTAILSSSGGNLGIGFAVPSDVAHKVMLDLIKYGYVVRGYLGVETQDLTPGLAKEFKLACANGVLIAGVVRNGPAARAGLQVGDVITRFDGKDVHNSRQLMLSVAEAKPGHVVAVEVMHDGAARSFRVIICEGADMEAIAMMAPSGFEQTPGSLQGVFIGELNSELRQKLRIPRDVHGAFVFDLHAYSMAAQAGLRPGDVIQSINRKEVTDAGEASRLAQDAKDRHTLLRVWRNAGSHFILIED